MVPVRIGMTAEPPARAGLDCGQECPPYGGSRVPLRIAQAPLFISLRIASSRVIPRHGAYALLKWNEPENSEPMNHPTPFSTPQNRRPSPPAAFHSLRAFIPRQTIRRQPMLRLPAPPSYETRAFPVELTYMS